MKNTLITSVIFFASIVGIPVNAGIVADYQSVETFNTPSGIERKLTINADDNSRYNIDVRVLGDVISSTDGKYQIPLANFVINNNVQDIDFKDNEYSSIFTNVSFDGVPKIITPRIRNYGMVPMGTYSIGLQVQATDLDTSQITNTLFNLQFNVTKNQNIQFNRGNAKFKAGASNALNKNAKILNEANTPITINSNCNWVLVLKTDSKFDSKPGIFYVRTIAGTSNVTERVQENIMLEEDKEIILARGKAPSTNEQVTVQYSLANRDGKFIPAGHFMSRIRYIIREDRG